MKLFASTTFLYIIFALSANAQSLTAISQKIKSLHNAGFTEVVKFKFSFQDEASVDTFKTQILIVPDEKQIGSYYKIAGKKRSIYLMVINTLGLIYGIPLTKWVKTQL
jgi:hypothetical protein